MSVKIRLSRRGRTKLPFYKILVMNSRSRRDGKFIDDLGYYNPLTKEIKIDSEKALSWLNNGAQPTETVASLFAKNNIEHKLISEAIAYKESKRNASSTASAE